MQGFVDLAKALSDPARVRVLLALRDGELCLCHLIALLELSPSTVSKHLDVLHRAGLVARRKEGRWCHFTLATRGAPAVRGALRWVAASLGESEEARRDAQVVRRLKKVDLTEVACCYR